MKKDSKLRRWAIGCFLDILASMGLYAQPAQFILQNQVTVGNSPDALIIGDIEGNGKPDLVVANQGSSLLSVLRGLGNGFFQSLPNQATGQSPRAVAAADLNRDGRLDLVVANFASNNVSVLLGNGNGTFRPFTILSATAPAALVAADFNRDGRLDLAVVESTSNTVSIFLGDGNGGFLPLLTAGVGDHPMSIAVSDFNDDGKPDLAVANLNSGDISILLGNGNGTFQQARNFAAGPLPAMVTLGDFNGDGEMDLAIANATGFSTSFISVLLGLGNGAFQAPRSFVAGSNASFLVAGDFNLDGKLDLAVANTGSNTISIFSGIGNGAFLPPLDFVVGSAPAWISIADLNVDGKPDLVVANSRSNTVSVLINRTAVPSRPLVTSAVNAASLKTGVVAPGELVTIFGSSLGPALATGLQLSPSGLVSTTLAQNQVLFDGIPSPLLYTSAGQIRAVVPYAVAGETNTQLVVTNYGQSSAALAIAVKDSAPALFTVDNTGQGQGAILNQDGSANGALNPAVRGSVVLLYATGAGQTDPPGIDGLRAVETLPVPVLPVSVTIDGRAAQVLYAGAAPGLVAGVMQVNARVPDGISSGAVPVVLQIGTAASQAGVTLSVQ